MKYFIKIEHNRIELQKYQFKTVREWKRLRATQLIEAN